jgi:GTP-binding protein
MHSMGEYVSLEYLVPTRGLLGYSTDFINDTRGEGTIVRRFDRFEAHKGDIPQRTNGVLISQVAGETMGYALMNLSERAQFFVDPGTTVYEGMIVGLNSRNDDMVVNPCKNKKMTNVRASGSDDAIKLSPPLHLSLEEALEFINDDELVEITPKEIRLRKKLLKELDRKRSGKNY